MQATLGYLLMLVVMTYSTPLFLCAIAGLILGECLPERLPFSPLHRALVLGLTTFCLSVHSGHGAFNWYATPSDGATPCCEGRDRRGREGGHPHPFT